MTGLRDWEGVTETDKKQQLCYDCSLSTFMQLVQTSRNGWKKITSSYYCFTTLFKTLNFHPILLSMIIPQGKHRFSSDHLNQALSGWVSTSMGDCLGILRVVDFSFSRPFYFHLCMFFLLGPPGLPIRATRKHKQLFTQIMRLKREAENMKTTRNDQEVNEMELLRSGSRAKRLLMTSNALV